MSHDAVFAYAKLNIKLEPLARGDLFEDRLSDALGNEDLAAVTGGGTMSSKDGEILYCGIDLDLFDLEKAIPAVCRILTELGAPKGSVLEVQSDEEPNAFPFGTQEGLGLYLNGTDLPEHIYKECSADYVWNEVGRLLGETGIPISHWSGPRETAIYMYGASFEEMKAKLADFVATYPLCQQARLVRIA